MATPAGQSRGRRAFSLIELLVVVMVVAVLIALILPAVQMAREASRHAQCGSNLHQIGIALNSYAAAQGCWPGGGNGRGYSFHAMLLPFLDQHAAFDALNFDALSNELSPNSPNLTVAYLEVGVFLCPSGRPEKRGGLVGTSYAGSAGVTYRDGRSNGAFAPGAVISLASFADGTSTTAAAAEWIIGPGGITIKDERGSVFATRVSLNGPKNFDAFTAECRDMPVERCDLVDNDKGRNWLQGGYRYTLYNHVLTANGHSCMSDGRTPEGAYTAGSNHPRGANVLFADGHLKFIGGAVSLVAWRSIGTRNGGEPVGDSDL